MMRPHPLYRGDYIAQSLAEVNAFNRLLIDYIKKKEAGEELIFPSFRYPSDYDNFNMIALATYADEKLSVANPSVYISNLDELMQAVSKCLQNYCVLLDVQETVIKQAMLDFKPTLENNQKYEYPFYEESLFLIRFKEYYIKKRNLFLSISSSPDNDEDNAEQPTRDGAILLKILSETITSLSTDKLQIICDHILYHKYGKPYPEEMPDLALNLEQNKLIQMIRKIIEKLNLVTSRKFLADLFSKIPHSYINLKAKYYNYNTIYKKI